MARLALPRPDHPDLVLMDIQMPAIGGRHGSVSQTDTHRRCALVCTPCGGQQRRAPWVPRRSPGLGGTSDLSTSLSARQILTGPKFHFISGWALATLAFDLI
jgi:hypothetical protein